MLGDTDNELVSHSFLDAADMLREANVASVQPLRLHAAALQRGGSAARIAVECLLGKMMSSNQQSDDTMTTLCLYLILPSSYHSIIILQQGRPFSFFTFKYLVYGISLSGFLQFQRKCPVINHARY